MTCTQCGQYITPEIGCVCVGDKLIPLHPKPEKKDRDHAKEIIDCIELKGG